MKTKIYLTLLIMVLLMSGCMSKDPTHIDLEITSSKEINSDEDNFSSPLMLLFYELSSADKFSKYQYWDLLDNAEQKLDQDVISQTKFIILPNEIHTYQIAFDEKAKYLGIVAKFRDIKESKWRHIINLEKDSANEAELKIDKNSIMEDE